MRRRLPPCVLFATVLASSLIPACGVPTRGAAPIAAPVADTTTRAMWVTRWNYRTREDVRRVVEECAHAGIDRILFQVRGNATAYYRSAFEPWAEPFGFADPGFDPLATAIEVAHGLGVELHAWFNVVPAWYGPVPPANAAHVYHAHPEWMWYDQHGKRQGLSEKFYVSLNPCLPDVRRYLADVARDLVSKYAVDGLHLDYIRFPNEPPATPAKSGIDYPRDARTLALYKNDTGLAPEQDKGSWDRWRTERVTSLVREIRAAIHGAKPGLPLSAAVGSKIESALTHFQDAATWLREGLVDTVYPMNYTADPADFEARCGVWRKLAPDRVVMGLHLGLGSPAVTEREIETSLAYFGGFAGFAYGSLWPSPQDPVDYPDAAARATRDARGAALVPVLRRFASEPAPARR